MVNNRAVYKTDPKISFILNDEETEIDPKQIKYISTEYLYQKKIMPVIYLSLNVQEEMYSLIVKHHDIAKMYLNIRKYDTKAASGMMEEYIKGQFTYILSDENPAYTLELDEGDDSQTYYQITIALINMNLLNKIKSSFNGIYGNITLHTLLAKTLEGLKCVVKPPIQNPKFNSIIIPPLNNKSKLLSFLFNKVNFYNTIYTFFVDFKVAYLLDISGEAVPAGDGKPDMVYINIDKISSDNSYYEGMEIKDDMYLVNINPGLTNTSVNDKQDKIANQIVVVNDDCEVNFVDLNVQKSIDSEVKQIFTRGNNTSIYNSLAETNIVTIEVVKENVDPAAFTPNRCYVVKNEADKRFDGIYIIDYKKEVIKNVNGDFGISIALGLKRVGKLTEFKRAEKKTSKSKSSKVTVIETPKKTKKKTTTADPSKKKKEVDNKKKLPDNAKKVTTAVKQTSSEKKTKEKEKDPKKPVTTKPKVNNAGKIIDTGKHNYSHTCKFCNEYLHAAKFEDLKNVIFNHMTEAHENWYNEVSLNFEFKERAKYRAICDVCGAHLNEHSTSQEAAAEYVNHYIQNHLSEADIDDPNINEEVETIEGSDGEAGTEITKYNATCEYCSYITPLYENEDDVISDYKNHVLSNHRDAIASNIERPEIDEIPVYEHRCGICVDPMEDPIVEEIETSEESEERLYKVSCPKCSGFNNYYNDYDTLMDEYETHYNANHATGMNTSNPFIATAENDYSIAEEAFKNHINTAHADIVDAFNMEKYANESVRQDQMEYKCQFCGTVLKSYNKEILTNKLREHVMEKHKKKIPNISKMFEEYEKNKINVVKEQAKKVNTTNKTKLTNTGKIIKDNTYSKTVSYYCPGCKEKFTSNDIAMLMAALSAHVSKERELDKSTNKINPISVSSIKSDSSSSLRRAPIDITDLL